MTASSVATVSASALYDTTSAILRAVAVPDADAALIADSLIEADRRGTHSHGVMRLSLYVRAVRAGGIVADAPMRWVRSQGASAVLDAANGFGQVAMARALDKARELAAEHATAVVAVHGSSHYGAGAYWAERLSRNGLVVVLASTTGASVTPFGGAERLLGTNPLTIAFPTGAGQPVVLDMATSNGAYGRIVEAARDGATIPGDWAVDGSGVPTTDPRAALAGALLPFGEHKGSGLAILLELLAGPLTGANLSSETVDIWADPSASMGTGHLIWAVDPAALLGDTSAMERAEAFQRRIRRTTPAPGVDAVLSPGDREFSRSAGQPERLTLPGSVLGELTGLAKDAGVAAPEPVE